MTGIQDAISKNLAPTLTAFEALSRPNTMLESVAGITGVMNGFNDAAFPVFKVRFLGLVRRSGRSGGLVGVGSRSSCHWFVLIIYFK